MSSDDIIGIDLGTTNSAIAIMEGGQPEIIENENGARTTPSVVGITDDGERLVGQQAKNQIVKNPENTVTSIKRHMGDEEYEVELQHDTYTPEEISAYILQHLKNDATEYLGEEPERAVITVPAYFNDKQREATKNAGKIADLKVERIVNEPTAAAMAYGLNDDSTQTVLVYDLGGGTFDVSVLEIQSEIYDVAATGGDNDLGGEDWTQKLMDWLLDEFEKEHGVDLREDPQAHQRVYDAAEDAKKQLSSRDKTEVNLPFITSTDKGPLHLEKSVSRTKFESLTTELLSRTEKPLRETLNEVEMSLSDMDEILLVGGATRMPMIKKQLENARQSVNPDEVVSLGAAVQGGIINGKVTDTILLDVTPLSLGVEVKGGLFKKLISQNTTIPVDETNIFTTGADNQTSVDIRVFQGEREVARKNELLGEFTLTGIPPAPAGTPRIKVEFSIDENGILEVGAVDEGSGKSADITIEGGIGLSEDEIREMKQEAEQFAKEDQERRERIQTENKAEASIREAERLLDEHVEEIEADKIADLRSQKDKTKGILENDDTDLKTLIETTQDLEKILKRCGGSVHENMLN